MTLADFESKGLLKKGQVDKQHILELLQEAESDLVDARRDVSPEWCFSVACSSVLNLCHALVHSSGYRADAEIKIRALQSLPAILGAERLKDTEYLLECLRIRNDFLNQENHVSPQQATGLVRFAENFYLEVIEWLRSFDQSLVVDSAISFAPQQEESLSLL